MPAHKNSLLGDLIVGATTQETKTEEPLTDRRLELLAQWKVDPWAWMTGTDEAGRPILWTKDEKDKTAPLKPFPAHLEYLHELVRALENEPFLAIEKSRQLYVTTTVLLHSAWDCAFHMARRVLLSKHKEREAEELLRDKVRFPWGQMPLWLQQAIPCSARPAIRADFRRVSSVIQGATENVAASEARGGSSSRTCIDEAGFQDGLDEILTACMEQAGQVVMWTTPPEGGPGKTTFKRYLPRYVQRVA